MNKNTKISQSQQALPIGQPSVQGIPKRNMLIPKGFALSNEKISSEKNFSDYLVEARLNINNRLDELSKLEKGWYDGEQGDVIPNLLKFRNSILENELIYIGNKPYIYPTIEGGLSIEWDIDTIHANLDVDMKTFKAEFSYYSDDTNDDEDNTLEFNLKLKKDWVSLQFQLSKLNLLSKLKV